MHEALAQADNSVGRVIVWSLVLIGVLVVLFAVTAWVRRRLRDGGSAPAGGGFTISDLRRMHQAGQITDEEFARAKARLAAAARGAMLGPDRSRRGEAPKSP